MLLLSAVIAMTMGGMLGFFFVSFSNSGASSAGLDLWAAGSMPGSCQGGTVQFCCSSEDPVMELPRPKTLALNPKT